MSKNRLVFIGGDAVGMSAGAQNRRHNPELEIVIVERDPSPPARSSIIGKKWLWMAAERVKLKILETNYRITVREKRR